MTNQHDVRESQFLRKIDPRRQISHLLTGHSPITAAANAFAPSPCRDIPQIMHSSVHVDAGITPLRQSPADPDIRRLIEIHAPTMHPDDYDRFAYIFGRTEDYACIDDVIR